jgi:predicted O-linked N-acetylglucosamine transferase (SPINDLY family)
MAAPAIAADGVPVITLLGSGTGARVAASTLHAIGLDDWIDHNPADYAAMAVKFAAMHVEQACRSSGAGCRTATNRPRPEAST